MNATAIYRYFNADGELLYVGISATPFRRWRQHGVSAAWSRQVTTITIEWFDTRHEADAAEAAAIERERPIYNKMARTGASVAPVEVDAGNILAEVKKWCARNHMPTTIFGLKALNDPNFVPQLEAGRECRRSTARKVVDFMASSRSVPARAAE